MPIQDPSHALFTKTLLTPGDLSQLLQVTVGQIRRIARTERIPGQRPTRGGQLRWQNCAQLKEYVAKRLQKKEFKTARQRYRMRRGRDARIRLFRYSALQRADRWVVHHSEQLKLSGDEARYLLNDFRHLWQFHKRLQRVAAS